MDILESESSTLLVGIMRWINMLLNGVLKSGPDFNENTEKLFHAVQNSPYCKGKQGSYFITIGRLNVHRLKFLLVTEKKKHNTI